MGGNYKTRTYNAVQRAVKERDALIRMMYGCLRNAVSTWEHDGIDLKYFKDQMKRMGIL